jgi:hypothetical protein
LLFGSAFLEEWNRRNPGVFELSQVLAQRSAMRLWAKNQPGPTDRQYAIYIASHFRATMNNAASWSSALALSLIKGKDRSFAEQSLTLQPAPTELELAEADATLKKYVSGPDVIAALRSPFFSLMTLNLSLAIYVCLPALIAALAFRGGLVLLLTGVTFVRRDGAPASRARLFWRALVAWIPLLPALVLSVFSMSGKSPLGAALALVVFSGLALFSVALPQRGLQDRLAGTWPVLR